MFSPVDRMNWRVRYLGISAEKTYVDGAPIYTENTFDSPPALRHLIDFRERKHQLNVYSKAEELELISRQLCTRYRARYPGLASVEVQYRYQLFEASTYNPSIPSLGPWSEWRPFRTFQCPS